MKKLLGFIIFSLLPSRRPLIAPPWDDVLVQTIFLFRTSIFDSDNNEQHQKIVNTDDNKI